MSAADPLPRPDYEPSDASPRLIVICGGLLALGLAISLGVSARLYAGRHHGRPSPAEVAERSFRHGPEQQPDIARDWAEQDRIVRLRLHTYGWVDRRTGIVRLPIERALDLVAAESAATSEGKSP